MICPIRIGSFSSYLSQQWESSTNPPDFYYAFVEIYPDVPVELWVSISPYGTISDLGSYSKTESSTFFATSEQSPEIFCLPTYVNIESVHLVGPCSEEATVTVRDNCLIVESESSAIVVVYYSFEARVYFVYTYYRVDKGLLIASPVSAGCDGLQLFEISFTHHSATSTAVPPGYTRITLAFYDVCDGTSISDVSGTIFPLDVSAPPITFTTGSTFYTTLYLLPGRYKLVASAPGYLLTTEDFLMNEIFEVRQSSTTQQTPSGPVLGFSFTVQGS